MPVIPKEKWNKIEQYLEYLRHLAAYTVLAEPFVGNKRVLEIGCGSGYGADYLSKFASSIVAIDISSEAISYCQDKYGKLNLVFMQANGLKLPFKCDSFDVVLSFQVIEHIDPRNVLNYLSEIKRVLNREGVFLVSTPNSRLRLLPFQKPWNPEHEREYNDEEFKKLLRHIFEEVTVYGLCDSDEIQTIGYGRLEQSPFKAYIMLPVYRLLSYLLPLSILTWLKKIKHRFLKRRNGYQLIAQEFFISKFSLNDFRVDPTCPRDCLDLYGICQKVAKRKVS